jgi:type II restriction/modification system DNA methylase subunit YeeA
MTAAEFKKKWRRYTGKETAAYQGHFDDLCRLLGQPTPAEADPSGSDFFCYQKRVVKDAELFELEETSDAGEPAERGFADVWKKGFFAWEYKGKKKSLDVAYKQLLRYRESLLNPPLLVVCDFDRYIIKTNFNGTVQDVYEFTNDQIDRKENLQILRALFEDPDYLKPQRTTAEVTEKLAGTIAEVAKSLQKREAEELADAKTRKEMNFAQRKNLRIARFLNRIVFCFFAEDTGLLPKNLFSDLLKTGVDDLKHLTRTLEKLFTVMAKGGDFGKDKIRHFNGHLFEESSIFELTEDELRKLADAGEADWQFIQPSIMGTLFQRALDESQRAQLGAHYTSEADIKILVEPVLMQPFRRDWAKIKGELAAAYAKGKGDATQRERLAKFQKQLSSVTVLDPGCGSGNFLYVSLQLLLGLEKEVIAFATQLGFTFKPQVSVSQLKAIEINPYAFELAQVSVQIGYLQWRRDNGFDNDRTPVLQVLDGFQNEDALLVPHFRSKARTLKEAQAGEHQRDDALKFYTEREWPKCDVIVSNPPFLGNYLLRKELSDAYVNGLFHGFGKRVAHGSDLCCYWFEKARDLIEHGKCKRAGLLATQGIRGGANREVLKRIKQTGDIFFALSDRKWTLDGAVVHVSMVGFDEGSEQLKTLDGKKTISINPNLTEHADTTEAIALKKNERLCFMGSSAKAPFDIPEQTALPMVVDCANAHKVANSDIVRPVASAVDLVQKNRRAWTLDFGSLPLADAVCYESPFAYVKEVVYPIRSKNTRQTNAEWWQYERPRIDMRKAMVGLARFVATPGVSKHRIYVWRTSETLCNQGTLVFARSDDYFFGVVHSRFHEVWALAQGTQLREKESGFRYTPTTCFETFPFPFPDDLQPPAAPPVEPPPKPREPDPNRAYAENLAAKNYFMGKEEPPPYGGSHNTPDNHRAAIASAAMELNELRENWLNPPEWTIETILEFPGSASGPWARYVVKPDKNGLGTVRYPRLGPRDADCAAKLKVRTLTKLYNEHPAWLDLAHKKLDAAVAAAYGWPANLTDEQILEKLLALNLRRAAEEAKAANVKKPKVSREKKADELI